MKEKILQKYTQLIKDMDSAIMNGQGGRWADSAIVTRIVTEAQNLIRKTCGDDSDYYINLKELNREFRAADSKKYKGVIEAAYNDYRDGFTNIDLFIKAEIFEDFLSMSEYLLEQGYNAPAASLAGGVLEDSLRKLCDKHGILYPEKTKINSLNTDLAKAGVYTALVSKEIIAKSDIRNNADHGKFKEFNEKDVKEMIEWIRRFIIDYLE
ncbi:MAG: HEPN domain-containing protein [Candidatus Pacebacteria bacterium]|nr:HEPN domain-containing protein [Candidatus Paceibacterota bacterium]